jgi:pilus assembly protein Flp/PilA
LLACNFHTIGSGKTKARAQKCSDSHVWIKGAYPMKSLVKRFAKDESGATAIEYGLIAAGISVAIISVVNGLGTKLTNTFSNVTSQMK